MPRVPPVTMATGVSDAEGVSNIELEELRMEGGGEDLHPVPMRDSLRQV
jgi:hypothetical protein